MFVLRNLSRRLKEGEIITSRICKHHNYRETNNHSMYHQHYSFFYKNLTTFNQSTLKIEPDKDPDIFGTLKDSRQAEFEPDDLLETQEIKRLELRTSEKRKRMIDYINDIRNLARDKKITEALALYDHILKINVKEDNSHLYVVVISICGRVGYTKKAFQVFKQMRDRGMKPTPALLTGLFNSCGNCPFPQYGLKRAYNLREKMESEGWHANKITYQAMIKAFGRCGDLATAFQLVDEMQNNRLSLTSETFGFLFMSCISSKESGFGYVIKALRKMEKMKIKPDIYSFNLILRAVRDCGIGLPELATELLQDFISIYYKPIQTEKTCAIESGMKMIGKSEKNLIEIGAPALELNDVSQTKYLEIVPKESRKSFKVSNELQIQPSNSNNEIVAVKPVATPQDRLSLLGGTSGILYKMREMDVKPDIKTFTLLLVTQDHNLKNEMALLDQMKEFNIKPDIDFFNVLIKQRALSMRDKEARDVLDLIISYHVLPDVATFGTLALTVRTTNEAIKFISDMEKANFQISIQIMGTFAGNAKIFTNFHLATYVLKKISLLQIKPDKKFLESMELLREKGRKTIYNVENNLWKTKPKYFDANFKKEYEIFCKIYKTWLLSTNVEMPEHPWKQFCNKESD